MKYCELYEQYRTPTHYYLEYYQCLLCFSTESSLPQIPLLEASVMSAETFGRNTRNGAQMLPVDFMLSTL